MTFNLLGEPWLPVYDLDGRVRDVSLENVFANGTACQDLAIGFAPERVAVTRFLVAVLQSALRGPAGKSARVRWLQDPGSAQAEVANYLERWRGRFDLFHPEWPFMQKPIDDDASDKSIAVLKLEWASGNNVTLFDHHRDDRPPELSPAQAARALLTTLLYQPGGGCQSRSTEPTHLALSRLSSLSTGPRCGRRSSATVLTTRRRGATFPATLRSGSATAITSPTRWARFRTDCSID